MKLSLRQQQEEEECNKYLNGIQKANAGESVFSSVISSAVTYSLYISAGICFFIDPNLFSASQCFLAASLCKEIYSAPASLSLQVMEIVKDTGQRQISVDLT